ncbi:MAG: hypothetical protein AB8C13_00280 [Phycisphaerales bacterium]
MNSHQKATAIILARAGSKGLPGKNHAVVGGKPCVEWTIDAAHRSSMIGTVVVSTDDAQVQQIASSHGCIVVDRPLEFANDHATIDSAARHAYQTIGSIAGPIVILYANVPVRPSALIDEAVIKLIDSQAHSVQSYARVGKHHPWWTVRVDEHGSVLPWQGDVLYHNCFRRQDLPPAMVPDGGVIAVTPESLMLELNNPELDLLSPHAFLGTDRRAVVTDEGDVIDIDSRIDQLVADAVLREQAVEGSAVHAHR